MTNPNRAELDVLPTKCDFCHREVGYDDLNVEEASMYSCTECYEKFEKDQRKFESKPIAEGE